MDGKNNNLKSQLTIYAAVGCRIETIDLLLNEFNVTNL